MEKTFTKDYRVTHKDTDFNGFLTLASLGNFILDTAGLHAIEINTSIDILNRQNLTWVVTGIHFDINRMPAINTDIKITTRIVDISRLACKRDFLVEQDGEKIADISTEWLIINRTSRRPVFLTEVLPHIPELITEGEQAAKYKHLRFTIDNPDSTQGHTVRYSDIDINRHLYSMRYIEWAMDLPDLETHEQQRLKSADVNYMSEVLYNQDVTMLMQRSGDSTLIEMQNSDNKPMFRAEFVWNNK
ncbi:MAG: hypothetical protein IKR94_10545 [Bacteroidales bacterium]|nr:hypothetical protein [Bacteroidales bacterium]